MFAFFYLHHHSIRTTSTSLYYFPMAALLERQLTWRDPSGRFPYTIQGRSWARIGTGFYIPELGLLLDAGWPTDVQPRAMVITHTHPDHCRHINEAAINRPDSFNVFCPPEAIEPLQGFLTAFARLRGCTTHIKWNWELSQAKLVPLAAEDGWVPVAVVSKKSIVEPPAPQLRKRHRRRENQLKLLADKPRLVPGATHPGAPPALRNLVVRAVQLRHSVPDTGYLFAECTRRLGDPEMVELNNKFKATCEQANASASGPAEAKALLAELKQAHTARMQAYAVATKKEALDQLRAEPTPALEAAIAARVQKLGENPDPAKVEAIRKQALYGEAKRAAQSKMNKVHYAPLLGFFVDCCSDSAIAAIDAACADPTAKPAAIMVECTYISDADAELAVRNRHVLWSRIRSATQRYPDVTFLLVHFSKRYTVKQLETFAMGLDSHVHAFFELSADGKAGPNGSGRPGLDADSGNARPDRCPGGPAGVDRCPPAQANGGAGLGPEAV